METSRAVDGPKIKASYNVNEISRVEVSCAYNENRCMYTAYIMTNDTTRLIAEEYVNGGEILRLLQVRVPHKATSEFDRFIEADVQRRHLNAEPIRIGRYRFEYPPEYKPDLLKPAGPSSSASPASRSRIELCRIEL